MNAQSWGSDGTLSSRLFLDLSSSVDIHLFLCASTLQPFFTKTKQTLGLLVDGQYYDSNLCFRPQPEHRERHSPIHHDGVLKVGPVTQSMRSILQVMAQSMQHSCSWFKCQERQVLVQYYCQETHFLSCDIPTISFLLITDVVRINDDVSQYFSQCHYYCGYHCWRSCCSDCHYYCRPSPLLSQLLLWLQSGMLPLLP